MGHALRFSEAEFQDLLSRRSTSGGKTAALEQKIAAHVRENPNAVIARVRGGELRVEKPAVTVLGIAGKWITIPLPPSANNYYRGDSKAVKTGRRFLTEAGRAFRREVRRVVRNCGQIRPMAGRLRVTVVCHMRTNGRSDVANREKALCDAFTKYGVWNDDSQIDDIRILRGVPVKGGRARVLVEEIPEHLIPLDGV